MTRPLLIVNPDFVKSGLGQSDSRHALTLTAHVVADPTNGPVYDPPPGKIINNIYIGKLLKVRPQHYCPLEQGDYRDPYIVQHQLGKVHFLFHCSRSSHGYLESTLTKILTRTESCHNKLRAIFLSGS